MIKTKKRVITFLIALLMIFSTSTTVFASWYGFSNKLNILGRTEQTIYDANYDGNNVGADIWITNEINIPSSVNFDFIIQKKEWYGWKDVAYASCSIASKGTVKAWNVGSGRYRFRVYIPVTYSEGKVYATKFESYSW